VRGERPGLQLSIASNNWRYLLMHLQSEELEFFVADTRDIAPDADLTVVPLCRQYGVFICRAGHPLLDRPQRTPRDMLAYGFASLKMPTGMQAIFRHILGLAPHERLPFTVECDNVTVLKQACLAEDLILLATDAAVVEEIAAGRLIPLSFPDLPLLYAEIGLVHLSGRTLSPAAAFVLGHFRRVAASLPKTGLYHDGVYDVPQ